MILGVGIDVVEVKRIEKAAQKAAFLSRVFSDRELELYRERKERDWLYWGESRTQYTSIEKLTL